MTDPKILPVLTCLGVVVVAVILLFFLSFETVTSGHVGVVRRFGAIKPQVMTEGFNTKMPFADTVIEVDIRMGAATYTSIALSKDLQSVTTEVALQYSLVASFVPKMYQKIGPREDVEAIILKPAIAESLKAVTAKFSTEELIKNRQDAKSKIMQEIQNYINKSLSDKGLVGAIEISNIAITDFQFSEKFNNSIEAKIRAEQEALQAKNEKERIVTQAQAAAEKRKIEADAEAYEIRVQAEARSKAIKSEAMALKGNQELIQLRIAESWDGHLPQFTGGNGIPLLDLGNIAGSGSRKARRIDHAQRQVAENRRNRKRRALA